MKHLMLYACSGATLAVASVAAHAFAQRSPTTPVAPYSHVSPARVTARAVTNFAARGGGPTDRDTAEVHDHFRRDLQNGCEYRTDVLGTSSRPAQGAKGGEFRADVSVRSSVHCPNVPSVAQAPRRVVVRATSSDQLARQLAAHATVRATNTGPACTYVPAFSWGSDQLKPVDVSYRCRAADGRVETGGTYAAPDDDASSDERDLGTP